MITKQDLEKIYQNTTITKVSEWAYENFGVKLDTSILSKQKNGKIKVSDAYQIVYKIFLKEN
jgi:hypothetical protein